MARPDPRYEVWGWEPQLNDDQCVRLRMNGRYPIKLFNEAEDAGLAFAEVMRVVEYEDPTDYVGSYMYRTIGGSSQLSRHAYALAIDWDYGGDTDGDGDPTTDKNPHIRRPILPGDPGFGVIWQILEHQVRAVEALRTNTGKQVWRWLGWAIGDTMHFDINCSRADLATGIDPSSIVTEDDMFKQFVAGWVEAQAEDAAGTRERFVRLFGEQGLEPAEQNETNYWMSKLPNPNDPEWPGFYGRRELEFWAQSSEAGGGE